MATDAEKNKLVVLASFGGDAEQAASALSRTTAEKLTLLRLKYPKEYAAGVALCERALETQLANEAREIALLATRTERKALERVEASLPTMQAKDAARAARDLSHVKGQNVDKLLTLTGRPTEITEDRSVREIMRGLVSRGVLAPPQADADTTGEEITDAIPEKAES